MLYHLAIRKRIHGRGAREGARVGELPLTREPLRLSQPKFACESAPARLLAQVQSSRGRDDAERLGGDRGWMRSGAQSGELRRSRADLIGERVARERSVAE